MRSATWEEVRARRLARSSLVGRAPAERMVFVAAALAGVHAQVQASAELQLGARVEGIVRADVRAALWEERSLVKAWTIRGTLHLHPAGELPLWLAARRAVAAGTGGRALEAWRDPQGVLHPPVGADEVEETRAAVHDALDGRCLERTELVEAVAERARPAVRERLRSGFAFFLDDLCQGPPRGARVTFARPDQWLDRWVDVDEEQALREACRRYLGTYGPARPSDFREWIGGRAFGPADAQALFEALGDELEAVDVEGRRAWVLAGDAAFPDPEPSVRLLPEYDVYVMGSRERDRLVPQPVREQVAARGRGRYEGPAGVRLLLVDGVAAGLWERRVRGRRLELRVTPVRRLAAARCAELAREVERLGAFAGLEPVLAPD